MRDLAFHEVKKNQEYVVLENGTEVFRVTRSQGETGFWVATDPQGQRIGAPDRYRHDLFERLKHNTPRVMEENAIEAVAKAICEACGENPTHTGDCRGNDFRWQDYRDIALSAMKAMEESTCERLPVHVVAGYTTEDMESEKRAFTVYRAYEDAALEAKATRGPLTTLFRYVE